MRGVVQFNRGDNARVLVADKEVNAHPIDAIVPGACVMPALDTKKSRQDDLSEHHMVRQGSAESEVQNLFGLR
jgi:hypothetical protein